MKIEQFEIWIADLNPRKGTESGKKRPVLVVQTNLLNKAKHPSTIVCPLTSVVKKELDILRLHLKKGIANLDRDCDVMIDQIRAIDNNRLEEKIGNLPEEAVNKLKENLLIVMDLEG